MSKSPRPILVSYEDSALDSVVEILNQARHRVGDRQNLSQLASSRNEFIPEAKVSLSGLESPLVKNCYKLIKDSIENVWKLTEIFMYHLHYLGRTMDETSQYLYYEAVFSQPTVAYPIPQATVSVFFRTKEEHLQENGPLQMTFRLEGHHSDHDVRRVFLLADWILALIKIKIDFNRKIENMLLF